MNHPSSVHHPVPGGLPFNNLPGPLTAKDALRLPGDNLIKRIFWALLMMASMKSYAATQRSVHDFKEIALEEEIDKQLKAHKMKQKRRGHIGRQDGGPGHEEGFDAGEIDQFDNGSPEGLAMYESHDKKEVHWILRLIRIYYITFLIIYNMLGLKRDEQGELSDEALDQWLVKNDNNLEFRRLKLHLLNNLSEHSTVFNLTQIEFADRFLTRLAATLCIAQTHVVQLQALDQVQLGQALSQAYSQQMAQMTALSNEMVQAVASTAAAAGITLKQPEAMPNATANPSARQLNQAVAGMGEAQHAQDHGQQLAMERIATIKTMFPMVPKPQNTQKRDHASETGEKHAHAKKPGHDLSKFNTNAAMGNELVQYANAIGVDPRVLEQAADHTHDSVLKLNGPEHGASKQAKRETTGVPLLEHAPASKPAASKPSAPKPPPPASRGS